MPSEDQSVEFYQWTQSMMKESGLEQYEISSWGKPEKYCQHNIHYWEIDPYLAFGPSAHGYDGIHRFANVRNLDSYIKMLGKGEVPRQDTYELSDIDRTNEMIGFGLRTKNGINLDHIPKSYFNMVNKAIERNQSKWGDYYILGENRLKLTPQGFVFADAIAVDLMIPAP